MTLSGLLRAAFLTALCVISASAARADVGSGLIGNTVILSAADGAVTRVFYQDEKTIIIRATDGTLAIGQWRVKDNSICTRMGDNQPENCTAAIDQPPVAGSSGVITGEHGDIRWSVIAGKGF